MKDDLFIEMLDVFIQSILYVRGIYPEGAFRRRKVYNTVAYISIHPDINSYLKNVLLTARTLKTEQTLRSVELILFCEQEFFFGSPKEEVLERYVFYISPDDNNDSIQNVDDLLDHIIHLEEELRSGLLKLNSTTKELPGFTSKSCSFHVRLQTTNTAFVEQCERDNASPDVRIFVFNSRQLTLVYPNDFSF